MVGSMFGVDAMGISLSAVGVREGAMMKLEVSRGWVRKGRKCRVVYLITVLSNFGALHE